MLKAWHLPVAPFIKVQQDRLFITLWLSGESLPQRITLRAEEDNEELSLPMQRLRRRRSQAWWHGAVKSLSPAASRAAATALSCCGPTISAGLRHKVSPVSRRPGWNSLPLTCRTPARSGWPIRCSIRFSPIALPAAPRVTPTRMRSITITRRDGEIVRKAWDEPLTGEAGGSTFYGGDLDGISEKLPYLKQLGVTALYLNPVFAAPSVHKYDTEDYRRVDPQFGGDAALLQLRHNTQRAGMRMILDGVFNHTGDSHPLVRPTPAGQRRRRPLPGFSVARLVYLLRGGAGAQLAGLCQSAEARLSLDQPGQRDLCRRGQYRTPLAESAVEHGRLASGRGAYAGRRRRGAE